MWYLAIQFNNKEILILSGNAQATEKKRDAWNNNKTEMLSRNKWPDTPKIASMLLSSASWLHAPLNKGFFNAFVKTPFPFYIVDILVKFHFYI